MNEKYFKELLQKWFEKELSSAPEIKPTEEMYALLQKKVEKERSFFYRSRWFMAAAAMFFLVFLTINNFQQIFYPAPILEVELDTRDAVKEEAEIMFERSLKLHSKKGAPVTEEIIFQFQREGSAFIIDVDMEQKLDYPLGLSPSDNYRLSITVHNTFYLYIFQINSENIPIKLFPGEDPGSQNPLETGKNYYLPGEEKWYFLDEQTGDEQLYICISEQDIPELEEYYSQFYETRSASKKEKILAQLINKLVEEESNYFLIENQ